MTKEKRIQGLLLALIAALMVVLFHFLGNTADVHIFGRSSIAWMVRRWDDYGGQFSHCYFIPLISAWIIWRRRGELAAAVGKSSYRGLAVVIAALLLQLLSARPRPTRLSLVSLIGLLWGIPWCLYGNRVAKLLLFPCAYLFFCIPLTFLDSLTFPLRVWASASSVFLLNGMGIAARRMGTAVCSLKADGFRLDVADACSGLRYFLVMLSLSAAYGYFTQKTLLKKWAMFIAGAPLAIAANIARIVAIAIVAETMGQEAAIGAYHDFSGYIVFVTAVSLMIGFGALLNCNSAKRFREWKDRRCGNGSVTSV